VYCCLAHRKVRIKLCGHILSNSQLFFISKTSFVVKKLLSKKRELEFVSRRLHEGEVNSSRQ